MIVPVGSRDWLADWSHFARVLAESEIVDARAALVDTNGDGRELWFGLDVRDPSGAWTMVLDWDDVGGNHPLERAPAPDCDVVVGWGTGQARQRRTVDYADGGDSYPVRVNRDGWWILVVNVATDPANAEMG